MSATIERLETVVMKRYGTDTEQGELALIVGACDAPTFNLLRLDGQRFHWRQDLTRPATPEETAEYWKQRALIAEDKTTEEISKEVFLSPRTIETIRQNMKQKVGAKTIAGLVMYAMRNKLLE